MKRRTGTEEREPVPTNEQILIFDRPIHKVRESLFSTGSGFVNYRGLLNNCIICLLLSNFHNILRNFNKYGLLINPAQWVTISLQMGTLPAILSILCLFSVFPLLTFLLEKAASKGLLKERLLLILHASNMIMLLALPVGVVFWFKLGPAAGFIVMFNYSIVWMKMMSYIQVNSWCRCGQGGVATPTNNNHDKPLVQYPDNITVKDFCYFIAAPTLCYELNYPRTPKIRKIFLLRRTLESIFLVNILLALSQQWLVPTVMGSLEPLQSMDLLMMIQRGLLLALPNHLLWLLLFYFYFHSYLNVLAELLRFGDRSFYKDWWNADSIDTFWRHWNVPVHRWAARHVYYPLLSRGYSRVMSQIAVFLLSAFFHEYLVSIPLRMLRPWAFTAMLSQVPLALLTSLEVMRGQPGNVVVWVSIILGQPLAIMMYMHDYLIHNKL
ncbi:PREDICTED: diacylglycerol O-acyltransferase 1-like isoform X1 [Amphimedon queenslandica]|uniref:O-acyltransferase n=5 Tax=Amphimedon queenslandica TaxID=400682 RepID=I1F3D4_AMPQE|nr:PREDICTED: diacylglycerol O-acyltransferase 1-like isoform X1 [Amphimedon queenslandica]|eukprot:XP_019857821.1 PREDICTED: diacylglycerol O-acyltransferase 1-like isoform X1 [Amphimedon queenslandica]